MLMVSTVLCSINIKKESSVKMYDEPKFDKLPENIHDHSAEFVDQDQDIYEKIKSDSKKETKVKMYDTLKFEKLPENIHNHIAEFVDQDIYVKIKREIMNYFDMTDDKSIQSYQSNENQFVNLKVDVNNYKCGMRPYLFPKDYAKFETLGLQKITISVDSETKREINKSSLDKNKPFPVYDWDWTFNDLIISFHFKIPNEYSSKLKKTNTTLY
jgi:hypothetical protein